MISTTGLINAIATLAIPSIILASADTTPFHAASQFPVKAPVIKSHNPVKTPMIFPTIATTVSSTSAIL